MNKHIIFFIWLTVLTAIFLSVNCKDGSIIDPPLTDPNPEVDSLDPGSMVSHLDGFTLTVNGNYFTDGMVIMFNGIAKDTTYVDANQLTCRIEAVDINSSTTLSGINQVPERTVEVYVVGPAPDNLQSNRVNFSILDSFRFSEPLNISNSSGRAVLPQIAIDDDDKIFACWRDNLNSFWVIYYTESTDYGATWLVPRRVSSEFRDSFNPYIFTGTSGKVYMVWDRQVDGGASQIFFSRSNNSGLMWSRAAAITNSDVHSWQARGIVDENGNLLVVWTEYKRNRNYEVYFSRSNDDGSTWSPPVSIYAHSSKSVEPVIATGQGQTVFVAWKNILPEKGNVFSSRSLDGGITWEPPINHSNTADDECREPVMATAKDGNPCIAWHQSIVGGGFDVMFTYSSGYGQSWSPASEISGPSFYSSFPALAPDRFGNVNAVWVGNGNDIYFIRSVDKGEKWLTEHSIFASQREGGSLFPDMAVDSNGFVYVVWEDNITGSSQIFFGSSRM